MSRYHVQVAEWPQEFTLVVGWDEMLESYFAQVYNGKPHDPDSDCLVWIGTVEKIETVDDLLEQLNNSFSEDSPAAVLPADIRSQLENDRSSGGED